MDFIRADKLAKREERKRKKELRVTWKRYRGPFFLIVFFILGFFISFLLFYQPEFKFPSTLIIAENAKLIPIVDRNYYDIVLPEIQNAQESIDIAMFQFKFYETESNKVRLLSEALADAADRGVKIRVLLDQSDWSPSIRKDNEGTFTFLLEHGIQVQFDNPKKTLHAKLWIIDDNVIIGSTNLGFSALERNHEASLLVRNKALADYYLLYFESLWS